MNRYYKLRQSIEQWNQNGNFPEIDTNKYVDFYTEFPLFMYAPQIIKEQARVHINKIYGNNWAFQDSNQRGSYPYYSKLDALLRGFTRTENQFYKGRKIPPIPLIKIFDKYYLEEGNHRLYVSKLLERKTIIADVIEIDYQYFLYNSYIRDNGFFKSIIYNNRMIDINSMEAISYKKLKNEL